MSQHDRYISPFSTRYSSDEMQYIFSDDNKFRTWRRLWVALARAEMEQGLTNITPDMVAELEAHVDDINKVTGYVRGGCSPVGMKKQYKTVFDESVLTQEKVYVSGGRIGTQVCCAPADLIRAARAITAKIIF